MPSGPLQSSPRFQILATSLVDTAMDQTLWKRRASNKSIYCKLLHLFVCWLISEITRLHQKLRPDQEAVLSNIMCTLAWYFGWSFEQEIFTNVKLGTLHFFYFTYATRQHQIWSRNLISKLSQMFALILFISSSLYIQPGNTRYGLEIWLLKCRRCLPWYSLFLLLYIYNQNQATQGIGWKFD